MSEGQHLPKLPWRRKDSWFCLEDHRKIVFAIERLFHAHKIILVHTKNCVSGLMYLKFLLNDNILEINKRNCILIHSDRVI